MLPLSYLPHLISSTNVLLTQGRMFYGLTGIPDDLKDFDCITCICGKMTQGPFQEGHVAAHNHLSHLHSDICGPMDVPSLGKQHYFCVLVNNKTGYLWFHTCFAKSDFTPWFIKMDSLFMNHYQSHVKILRSDQGREYINAVLEDYCAKFGIAMEFMVPHTPEQNGIAEHANWKILDKGHTIMKDSSAPEFLWVDAFATAVYAINRMAGSHSDSMTPFEAFFGEKPNISHMHVCASDIFIHH